MAKTKFGRLIRKMYELLNEAQVNILTFMDNDQHLMYVIGTLSELRKEVQELIDDSKTWKEHASLAWIKAECNGLIQVVEKILANNSDMLQ